MKAIKMKLGFSLLAMMISASVTISAQNIAQNYSNEQDITSSNELSAQETHTPRGRSGGISIDYMAVEKATGVGVHGVIKNVGFGLSYIFGETGGGVSSNLIARVDIGYNPQYWFNKYFFIDGYIGVGYWSGTISGHYQSNKKYEHFEEKTNCGFLTLTPRIGLAFNIGKGAIALKAGYRWDFTKFKFKKENQSDYFTIGLGYLW